jgi:hypothetical protein
LAFKTFDLLPKNEFDQLPNLTETFDLLFWSCAILSSDQTPYLTAISFFVSPYMYFIVLTERSFEQSLKIIWVVCFCRILRIFFVHLYLICSTWFRVIKTDSLKAKFLTFRNCIFTKKNFFNCRLWDESIPTWFFQQAFKVFINNRFMKPFSTRTWPLASFSYKVKSKYIKILL